MRFINTVEIDGHTCVTDIEYRMTLVHTTNGHKNVYHADTPTRFYEIGPVVAESENYTATIDAIIHCYVDDEWIKDIEYPMSEF